MKSAKETTLSLLLRMSSVGTTCTNNGFQPGDKKARESLSLFQRRSSVGTTDTNNGFQPGGQRRAEQNNFFIKNEFRRNDRY